MASLFCPERYAKPTPVYAPLSHPVTGVDLFSVATCDIKGMGQELTVQGKLTLPSRSFSPTHGTALAALECVSEHGKQSCKDLGGECVTERDGYYIVSGVCLGLGLISIIFHMIPTARKLQGASLDFVMAVPAARLMTRCSAADEQVEGVPVVYADKYNCASGCVYIDTKLCGEWDVRARVLRNFRDVGVEALRPDPEVGNAEEGRRVVASASASE